MQVLGNVMVHILRLYVLSPPTTSPQPAIKLPLSGLRFVLQLAGIRQLVLKIKAIEKYDVLTLAAIPPQGLLPSQPIFPCNPPLSCVCSACPNLNASIDLVSDVPHP